MTHEEHMKHFFNWFINMGYMNEEDIAKDGDLISEDMAKVREAAPRFYNFLVSICDA